MSGVWCLKLKDVKAISQSKELLKNIIDKVVLDEKTILKRIKQLAGKINRNYKRKELILIVVLKGALYFAADLMRYLTVPVILDFISISSYGESTQTSGVVRILKDIEEDINKKHCLIIEDIVDTGLTLSYLIKTLKLKKPASLKVCTLLDKRSRRVCETKLDYVGFEVPDKFLVGYGLDYHDKFRHIPFVFTVKPVRKSQSLEVEPSNGGKADYKKSLPR